MVPDRVAQIKVRILNDSADRKDYYHPSCYQERQKVPQVDKLRKTSQSLKPPSQPASPPRTAQFLTFSGVVLFVGIILVLANAMRERPVYADTPTDVVAFVSDSPSTPVEKVCLWPMTCSADPVPIEGVPVPAAPTVVVVEKIVERIVYLPAVPQVATKATTTARTVRKQRDDVYGAHCKFMGEHGGWCLSETYCWHARRDCVNASNDPEMRFLVD